VDLAVLEATRDSGLYEAMLLDSRETVELGGSDLDPQMVAAACFIADEHVSPRQRGLNQRLDLS